MPVAIWAEMRHGERRCSRVRHKILCLYTSRSLENAETGCTQQQQQQQQQQQILPKAFQRPATLVTIAHTSEDVHDPQQSPGFIR